jgi:hypothetical protein
MPWAASVAAAVLLLMFAGIQQLGAVTTPATPAPPPLRIASPIAARTISPDELPPPRPIRRLIPAATFD